MTMPVCVCNRGFATVELEVQGRHVLLCEDCAAMTQMITRLLGAEAKRRPFLAIVPRGSVE